MANILLSFHSPGINNSITNVVCLYDSLAKALTDNGNNVKIFNTMFFKSYEATTIPCKKLTKAVELEILDFNPDLVLSFNHQMFETLKDIIDCPIAIVEADSLDLFPGIEILQANIDRYHFLTFSRERLKIFTEFGVPENRKFYLPHFTAVQSEDIAQDKNISIIGSLFDKSENLKQQLMFNNNDRKFTDLCLSFYKNPEYDVQKLLARENLSELEMSNEDLWSLVDDRVTVLHSLIDQGLHVYGISDNWQPVYKSTPALFACCHFEPKFSLAHNQQIYNSSKICININHPQARSESYSWRVLDIMASNGCLVSSFSSDLLKQAKGYVDIPFFDNPWDARALCQKILKEDNLRLDIVAGSQKFVKDFGSVSRAIDCLEGVFNIPMSNIQGDGERTFIRPFGKNEPYHTKSNSLKFKTKISKTKRLSITVEVT